MGMLQGQPHLSLPILGEQSMENPWSVADSGRNS